MTNLYRISPKEKKQSIEYILKIEDTDHSLANGFDVVFCYQWGQGFRPELNPPTPAEIESNQIECDINLGWGPELVNLLSVHVDFSYGYLEEEKEVILKYLNGELEDEQGRSGEIYIKKGQHEYKIVSEKLVIHGPYNIDLVNEQQYNVDLQSA